MSVKDRKGKILQNKWRNLEAEIENKVLSKDEVLGNVFDNKMVDWSNGLISNKFSTEGYEFESQSAQR